MQSITHGKFVLMNSLFQSQVFCHAQVVKDELLIWNLSGCSFKNKSIVINYVNQCLPNWKYV